MINNAIADLNIKSSNLSADFSSSNSSTLSVLFKSYCMNIYDSTLWSCEDTITIQILRVFVFLEGKLLDDYGRHPIELIIV